MKKKTGSLMEGGMKRLHFDGLQDEESILYNNIIWFLCQHSLNGFYERMVLDMNFASQIH